LRRSCCLISAILAAPCCTWRHSRVPRFLWRDENDELPNKSRKTAGLAGADSHCSNGELGLVGGMHHNDRSLEGFWEMVRAEFAGEAAPELVVCKTSLLFSGDTYAVRFDGQVVDQGHFALVESTGHLMLTLTGASGTNAGRTIPAIYQQTGERLRICFGFDGVLPARFETAVGSQLYLATYRRRAAA
jgi:uncharacterized protein (TIGR03067 family)